MCRFLAYIGEPILMNELLFKPKNSIIKQSIKAHEAEEPLNGDGFGIGWYTPDANDQPGLFVSVRPAWNDRNLQYIAPKILSDCLFAHVRAASAGVVNELNCHPFHFGNYLFMHNGDIEDFHLIKREIINWLPENIYLSIEGQTDSEHLFALFLNQLNKQKASDQAARMANALEDAIAEVEQIKRKLGIHSACYINACVSDGNNIVAVRYVTDLALQASTLYYSVGEAFICEDGICKMKDSDTAGNKAVLVVSERLTNYRSDWYAVPVNHLIAISKTTGNNLKIDQRELKFG